MKNPSHRAANLANTRRTLGKLSLIALVLAALAHTAAAQERAITPPPVSGRSLSEPDSLLPSDVLARVELLRANIELLRAYMGRPKAPPSMLRVRSARPTEVYSQALNLELRSNRLIFEQLRVVRRESIPITREETPADVFAVIDSALVGVLLVKQDLAITKAVGEQAQPETMTPSDVFNATVAAGSEINNLLETKTSPSDAYQLVTSAVHMAASIHATIPNGPNMPEEEAFQPNISPADVIERLILCFGQVSRISAAKDLHLLELDLSADALEHISPNDVSDMASLLVEELADLHPLFPNARIPTRSYYPGRRFPAHVYQRVGLLEAILADLVRAYSPGRVELRSGG